MREDGEENLETLYIGSLEKRGKKGIFRAYDKGVQLGIDNETVTRLEVELRGDKAHNAAKRISQGASIAGNFRTTFNCASPHPPKFPNIENWTTEMIERHVDYLVASLPFEEHVCRDENYKIISPIQFYKRGYSDDTGTRYYYGNPKTVKALAVLSGETLATIRAGNRLDGEIVDNFLSRQAKISRIDLAVTDYIEDEFCTVEEVKSWVRDKLVTSTLLGHGNLSLSKLKENGEEELETFYIGSLQKRGKKGIFRAYDKGVQSGLSPQIITRLELEIRCTKAHNTARRIAQSGDIAGNFRSSFDVKSQHFERLMDAPAVSTMRGKNMQLRDEIKENLNRWSWLINQVAPSVKIAMRSDTELELSDVNLTKFLVKSGLAEIMRNEATRLANEKYRVMLLDIEARLK